MLGASFDNGAVLTFAKVKPRARNRVVERIVAGSVLFLLVLSLALVEWVSFESWVAKAWGLEIVKGGDSTTGERVYKRKGNSARNKHRLCS